MATTDFLIAAALNDPENHTSTFDSAMILADNVSTGRHRARMIECEKLNEWGAMTRMLGATLTLKQLRVIYEFLR